MKVVVALFVSLSAGTPLCTQRRRVGCRHSSQQAGVLAGATLKSFTIELYHLKSTTKSFGATMLGLAVIDGKVKLHDPVMKYCPDVFVQ
jgi:CubicO group peptidase (beta-lactamase class C family)